MGWVRNLSDGAVEVVGLASAETLAEFEAIVRRGPPGASVERLTSSDVPHHDVEAKSFHIKR
jgi:acylphosphatase